MIGEDFQRRRKGMNLTQRELGELLGYDEMSISRFERNERAIPRLVELAIDRLGIQHFLRLEQNWLRRRLLDLGYSATETLEIMRGQGWV